MGLGPVLGLELVEDQAEAVVGLVEQDRGQAVLGLAQVVEAEVESEELVELVVERENRVGNRTFSVHQPSRKTHHHHTD